MLGATLLIVSACGDKLDQPSLEKKVAEDWRHCERVKPEKVTIEASDKRHVRYSYVLRVVVDGAATGYTCYKSEAKLLEALANKDLFQTRAGDEIEVTQEILR